MLPRALIKLTVLAAVSNGFGPTHAHAQPVQEAWT